MVMSFIDHVTDKSKTSQSLLALLCICWCAVVAFGFACIWLKLYHSPGVSAVRRILKTSPAFDCENVREVSLGVSVVIRLKLRISAMCIFFYKLSFLDVDHISHSCSGTVGGVEDMSGLQEPVLVKMSFTS